MLQWWLDDGEGWRRDASEPLSEPFASCKTTVDRGDLEREYKSANSQRRDRLQCDSRLRRRRSHRWRHRVRFGFDRTFQQLRRRSRGRADAPDPYLAEFSNLYAGGVYDNRPATKRYQCTIWNHPDGRWLRWPHNPVSYLTPGMNSREGERRIAAGGFIGYFADPHSNPVVEILNAEPAVAAATCSNLYDEHLLRLRTGNQQTAFTVGALSYRFFSVAPDARAADRFRVTAGEVGESIRIIATPCCTILGVMTRAARPPVPSQSAVPDVLLRARERLRAAGAVRPARHRQHDLGFGKPRERGLLGPRVGHSGHCSIRLRATTIARTFERELPEDLRCISKAIAVTA